MNHSEASTIIFQVVASSRGDGVTSASFWNCVGFEIGAYSTFFYGFLKSEAATESKIN